jgi:hypothetical protein
MKIFGCLLFVLLFQTAYSQQLTIIREEFNDNRFGWPSGGHDSVSYNLSGGKYFLDNRKIAGHLCGKFIDFTKDMNFSIEMEVVLVSGVQNYGHGMYYGRKNDSSFVQFLLTGNGYYFISVVKDKVETPISGGWKKSDLVKQGYNQVNHLKVVKEANTHTYYLNGVNVGSQTFDFDFTNRLLQMIVFNKQQAAYDNIVIKGWTTDNSVPGKITTAYNSSVPLQVASKATPVKEGRSKVFSVQIGKDYKYGIVDKNGYRIVDAINSYIYDYDKYGRTSIAKGEYKALIDENANPLTPFAFKYVGIMKEGLAHAYINKYYGVLDKDGNTVLPFIYEKLGDYSENLFYAELNGKSGIIDRTGKEVLPFGTIGLAASITKFEDGVLVVKDSLDKNVGMIDTKGKWIIQPGRYASIYKFPGNFVKVAINHPTQYGKMVHGLMTVSGKEILPTQYGDIKVEENFLIVGNDNCDLGLSYTRPGNCQFALATKNGKILTAFKYSDIVSNWRGSKYPLVYVGSTDAFFDFPSGGKIGYIDAMGKEIISPVYDNKNKAAYLDFSVRPYISEYQEGLFNLSKDGKWGYIDDKQNIVIPFQYEWASPFKNGKAKVTLNGEEFFIDKTGKKTTAPAEKNESDNDYKILPPIRTI